jgi:hypothetical protein
LDEFNTAGNSDNNASYWFEAAIFRLLGSIDNHQRVGFWRNMKKSQNHCTLMVTLPLPVLKNKGKLCMAEEPCTTCTKSILYPPVG